MTDWTTINLDHAPPGYRELRTNTVAVPQAKLSVFCLKGEDAEDWFQGQCTNDLRLLDVQDGIDLCLTKPTGQIRCLGRAWRRSDGLIVAATDSEALIDRVAQTVVMEDVELLQSPEHVCVQGPKAQRQGLPIDWTGSGGFLVPKSEAPSLTALSDDAWNLATLEHGHPLADVDFTNKTLPPELGPAFESRYVSYQKGCYTGQEVLVRIRSRGHTNKTWVVLRSESALALGAAVLYEGKEVGVVHRRAQSPVFGHIATATVRNVAAQDGSVVTANDKTATVSASGLLYS